jgi:hypothetical protein
MWVRRGGSGCRLARSASWRSGQPLSAAGTGRGRWGMGAGPEALPASRTEISARTASHCHRAPPGWGEGEQPGGVDPTAAAAPEVAQGGRSIQCRGGGLGRRGGGRGRGDGAQPAAGGRRLGFGAALASGEALPQPGSRQAVQEQQPHRGAPPRRPDPLPAGPAQHQRSGLRRLRLNHPEDRARPDIQYAVGWHQMGDEPGSAGTAAPTAFPAQREAAAAVALGAELHRPRPGGRHGRRREPERQRKRQSHGRAVAHGSVCLGPGWRGRVSARRGRGPGC